MPLTYDGQLLPEQPHYSAHGSNTAEYSPSGASLCLKIEPCKLVQMPPSTPFRCIATAPSIAIS